jgi:hypothetical protein
LKVWEYYVAPHVDSVEDGWYQLYWAVCDGNVRARYKGRIFSSQEAYKLRETKWGGDCFDLPPDIELSVDDALAIWRPSSSEKTGKLENKVAAVPSANASVSKESKPADRTSGPKRSVEQESIAVAIEALWSNVVPSGMPVKERNKKIMAWQRDKGRAVVSDRTIRRYFSNLKFGE